MSGMSEDGRSLLLSATAEMGLDVSEHLDAFSVFQEMLTETGKTTNLTSLLDERSIVLKHFADSLTCLLSAELDGPLSVLDLGTGAGFPGLPLAIVRPQIQATLLDATRRKIEFVDAVVAALGLGNASGLTGRAELLARQLHSRATFDRVVTRAVSALPVLIELALPLLKMDGLLIAQKAQLTEAEATAGRRAAAEVGGELQRIQSFSLPILGDPRTLVTVRKTRHTPERYPRREGVPARKPLF
ncbi:16S rRNA (guanine(527)-N(7))-methyltransferase RsmG [Deinococcus sp.]|uniref:16S rRNA (guanine(527)-N(7))-methyltransferase RsmG n=1 Tax=Deinococcus sp. TaxID=47478 RepID=UPI003CC5DF64